MEFLAVGVWRAKSVAAAACRRAVLDDWAGAALERDDVRALTVNVSDVDQGIYTREPDDEGLTSNVDAFVMIGLDSAHELDSLPERELLHSLARRVDVWRVEARPRKEPLRTTPIGVPTPGVKLVSFMRRAEGLTHEQFVRHWTERHTPLALEHHAGLWAYSQIVVRRAFTPSGRHVDGIAELHFATRDDFEHRFFGSDTGRALIMEDVDRFMQRDWSGAALTTERILR